MAFYRKKLITFFINEECNMRCVYCPIHSENSPNKKNPKVIDLHFAKRGIDDYFSNNFFREGEKKAIRIFSNGEATLEFETLKLIVKYAHQKANDKLFVEMQTNGYFSREIAEWISSNIDLLWVSLDGLADIQDKQRPASDNSSTFKLIDENIKLINESKRTFVGLRPTISKYNLKRQTELIDYALDNELIAVYADPWGGATDEKGKPDLMKFAKEFLSAWKYAKDRGLTYGTEMTVNFDERTDIYCRSCLPAPQFTPDGYVSSCDMVNNKECFLARIFPELIFGYYKKDEDKIYYNPENIKKIKTRNIYNLKACRGCIALKHCAGGCMGLALARSLDFYGVNKDYCRVVRYLYRNMAEAINEGYDKNKPIHP